MMRILMSGKIFLVVLFLLSNALYVEALSIYDIQYTEDPTGDSPLVGQTVDCAGGVVLHKFLGGKTKLAIYDPANPSGWGGIFAVTTGTEFAEVEVGDVVSFTSMLVEEYRGNTQLVYGPGSAFSKLSTSALPSPLVVSPSDIAYPVDAGHSSELYEAMLVQVQDVTVAALDQGKNADNYALQNVNGTCWATDYYIGAELGGATYHPYVQAGAQLDSVTGIIEQYTRNEWDYYQLCTRTINDVVVPEPVSILLLGVGGSLICRRRRGR
ncbi:MAG: hypothetical protein BWY71_01320 [Planctomycetes bacterium ADurb.Bin412]|nr:MAG: hypothetical protein BWY71_01320 [Planctomycetes bacterium ADurb.Bin412]